MERYETEINDSKISIFIRIVDKLDKPNFKAIANVNFGWFEIVGFRITYFDGNAKSGYVKPRREDCLDVQPPKYPQGPFKWTEAFRTVAPVKDTIERERVRKQYWYNLQDAIIDAYSSFLTLEKEDGESTLTKKDYYPNLAKEIEELMDNEIDIEKISFK